MKKIFTTIVIATMLCGVWQAQAQYIFTPKKMFEYWMSRTANFDSITSTAINAYNYSYSVDYGPRVDIKGKNANGIYTGVNLTFVHSNQPAYLYYRYDSVFMQATVDQGVTIALTAAVNPTAGGKKILFEYSSTNDNGRIIEIVCGSDVEYDTLMVGRPTHRVASYVVKNSGAQTINIKNKKLAPWASGGNLNIFRIEIVDAASNYTLSTPCLPVNGGTVIKSPHKDGYPKESSVLLTATPKSGYAFTRWSDGVTSDVRTIVMPAKDTTLIAQFTAIDYTFAVEANPANMGSVTVKEGAIPTAVHVGDVFTLTAVPSHPKYRFVKWADNNSTNPKRTFTMLAANTIITAVFEDQPICGVQVTINPPAAGIATDTGRIMREDWHQYYTGDIVDLRATPNVGYEFVNWSDGSDDPSHAVRIVGDSSVKITANFRAATGTPPTPTVYPHPLIKVDFNMSGRQTKEVGEPGFNSWVVTNQDFVKTIDGVTFTMAKEGEVGKGFRSTWDKLTVQAPYYSRLVGDGIAVDMSDLDADLDKGTQMSMKIEGLKKGKHSILLYLNNTDNPKDSKTGDTVLFSPVKIYINGDSVANVMPSNRAINADEAASLFLELPVRELEDIVIHMAADPSPITHVTHNIPDTVGIKVVRIVTFSAFILNEPNPNEKAWSPTPANRDEHVDSKVAGDKVTLSWRTARDGATTHHVYLGNDFLEIDAADKTSTTYKGAQADTFYLVSNVSVMKTYYWRVDEEKDGVVTKGDVWYFRPRVLAFPGAEGYGKWARGGRGGKVMYVTNLNDNGAGSLRDLTGSGDNDLGARYILFAVGGRIHLNPGDRITLNQPYVTVAGQTAPGKGVCISGASYGVSGGTDVIVRFMRVRVGQFGVTIDGMGMSGANYSIMDHNTISWTHDEAFSSRGGKNFTLQNTLITESLNVAGHKNYGYGSGHGYAATIGGDTASFLRNLLTHNQGRNWSLGGGMYGDGFYSGHIDISNNVVYNYGGRVTDGGAHKVNFVNNYYKAGNASTSGMLKAQHESMGTGVQMYYYAGNVLEAYNGGNYGTFTCTGGAADGKSIDGRHCGFSSSWHENQRGNAQYYPGPSGDWYQDWSDVPFFPSHATVLPAKHAFKNVISNSGANMPVIDENDLRNILEARDGTWTYSGSFKNSYTQGIIDHHMDVGGYEAYPAITLNLDEFDTDRDGLPNWWEEEVSHTNPNGAIGDFTDTNTDPDNDGNTYMERYLEYMATPHLTTQKNRQVAVELSQYTRGYTKTPVYSVVSNGDGVISIDGNWARFQPTDNFKGVTYFEFKVTDSDGDSMIRKIGIRVTE